MRRSSIRSQLTFAFIRVSFLPLLLVAVVLLVLSFINLRASVLSREQSLADSVAGRVDDFFLRLESEISVTVKDLTSQQNLDRPDVIGRMPSFPDTIQTVILIDRNGVERGHIDRLNVVRLEDNQTWPYQKEFSIPKETRKLYYGSLIIDKKTGEPSITISAPIVDLVSGEVSGVLVTNVRFKKVWDLIASIVVDYGEQVYVVDSINRVVAHLNPSVMLGEQRFVPPAEQGPQTLPVSGLNGNLSSLATRQLRRGANEQVFTVVAEKDFLAGFALALQTLAVSAVVIILAILLASVQGFYAARFLTRPIQSLAEAAEVIRQGTEDFDPKSVQHVMDRPDELGQLARIFQNMGREVKVREQELKQQVQKLRVEIDQTKKEKQVAEITESDMFKELKVKAAAMRQRSASKPVVPESGTPVTPSATPTDSSQP